MLIAVYFPIVITRPKISIRAHLNAKIGTLGGLFESRGGACIMGGGGELGFEELSRAKKYYFGGVQ